MFRYVPATWLKSAFSRKNQHFLEKIDFLTDFCRIKNNNEKLRDIFCIRSLTSLVVLSSSFKFLQTAKCQMSNRQWGSNFQHLYHNNTMEVKKFVTSSLVFIILYGMNTVAMNGHRTFYIYTKKNFLDFVSGHDLGFTIGIFWKNLTCVNIWIGTGWRSML